MLRRDLDFVRKIAHLLAEVTQRRKLVLERVLTIANTDYLVPYALEVVSRPPAELPLAVALAHAGTLDRLAVGAGVLASPIAQVCDTRSLRGARAA